MANEANIDIEINNADVDRLINSLADLSRTLDGLTGEFRSTGRAAESAAGDLDKIERELEDVGTAARGAEQGIALMGVAAAGVATAFAVFEAGKIALESFAATNEEAAARMDILGQSAQSLVGSFGQILLGGENSSQTLEILTQTFEGLEEIVRNNSELLSSIATTVLRGLVRGFFFLIDSGLSVVEFFAQLDTNLLKVELAFTNLKIGALEFADAALEGIGGFVAGAIEKFADLLTAIDNIQTAVVDNPVMRRLLGIDPDEDITGPVGALADGLRSAAESIRGATTGRFADDIADAALKAEVLQEMISETPNPIRELRNEFMGLGYQIDNMFENIHTQAARGIDVDVRINETSGGGGGGGTGEQGSTEQQIDTSLELLIGQTSAGLQGAEKLYGEVLTRLLEVSADARREFALKGDIVPVNILSMAANSPLVAEFENMLAQRRSAIEEYEALQARLTSSIANNQRTIRESEIMLAAAAGIGQGTPPADEIANVAGIAEQYGISEEQVYAYKAAYDELAVSIEDSLIASGGFYAGQAGIGDRVYEEIEQNLQNSNNARRAAIREEQEVLRQATQENEAITSAGYERERALLEKFYNQTSQIVVEQTQHRVELERKARLQANRDAEEQASTVIAIVSQRNHELQSQAGKLVVFEGKIQERLSELYTGFGMRGDRDERTALIDLEQQRFDSAREGIDAITAALSRQEQRWIAANGGLAAYIDAVIESKEATKDAFKDTGIEIFEDSISQIGQFLGQTLAQSFDDGLTGAERTKKFLAEMLGGFLITIGQVAVAQAAVVAFGDPAAGGLPNPVRAGLLASAGLAAITVGSALSGAASKITASAPAATETSPASVGGGSGGGGSTEAITNIYIENRFGNRFDARELDRAAADSFARAASAGQA